MTLRKLPAALALGLVAALAAHAGLFGGTHAMGGAYGDLLVDLACLGIAVLVATTAAVSLAGAGAAADGSVLAARIERYLPGVIPVAAAAIASFAVGEALEPAHAAAGLPLAVLALVLSAYALVAAARALVRCIAHAVITVVRCAFALRETVRPRALQPIAIVHQAPALSRRFARPPPSLLTIVL